MFWSLFLNKVPGLKACNFVKKEVLTQVFSCKYCEIFKITFFEEHLRTAASSVMSDIILFQENESYSFRMCFNMVRRNIETKKIGEKNRYFTNRLEKKSE